MREDERTRRARLEHDDQPIAMVHDGIYVYANPAYLRLLGYESFDQLDGVPLLDTVIGRHQPRLRTHLAEALKVAESDRRQPKVKVHLLRADGSEQEVVIVSHSSWFEGEQTVLLTCYTRADVTLKNTFLRLPWKLYFSALFLIFFTILPSGLLLFLNVNNAPRIYLPADAPSVQVNDMLQEKFPNDQVILLLFDGVALYSDGFLKAFHALAETLAANPLIDDVKGITRQDHISGTADGFNVEPLLDMEDLERLRPLERRDRARADRFAGRTLIAADGSALSLLVVPVTINDSMARMALEDSILEQVEQHRLGGYLIAMAGQIVVDVAQLRSMLRDNMIFIPATVAIGLLLVWLMFRRLLAVAVTGITIGVVVSSTVAFYVLLDQPFNLISSIIPPLLSALTLAALIHLFNALHYAAKRGLSGQARVDWALREIRRPALFTSLTTVAGLASLGLSPIPPIRVFGLISAAGVVLIYLIVIHILPNIFARFDFADWPSRRSGMGVIDSLVRRLFHLGVRHPLAVVVVIIGGLLLSLPLIGKIQVETNMQEFFHPDHPARRATEVVEERLVGTTSLDVVFTSARQDGLKSPRVMKMIRGFQTWVESQPEVDKSISMADFVEDMNWGFHAEDPAYRRIPDDPQLLSQYLLVYDGEDLFDFVDQRYRLTHVRLSVNVHGANRISDLMDRIRDYLDQHRISDVSWDIAGFGRLFADQEDLLVKGQVYSLLGALVLIFLLLLVQWRSLGAALLCMVPNLSPILLIFIVMGLFGIWLDMATAMIASVAVGIAVDDTIHIYHGFIHRVRRGIQPVTALVRTYRQAGRAVMTTTVILCAQFLVLTLSQFVPTTHFGMLTTIGLLAALLFDLLLLPALLILIYGWRNRPLSSRKPLEI